jgi:immune inhibitor A
LSRRCSPLARTSLPNPRGESQEQLKKEAIARLIKGTATTELRNGSEVVSMGRGRWVELKKKADKVDPIFTILVQFGNQTDPLTGGTAGPAHNQIAEPDRSVDNSTLWQSDFSPGLLPPNGEWPGSVDGRFLLQAIGREVLGQRRCL